MADEKIQKSSSMAAKHRHQAQFTVQSAN